MWRVYWEGGWVIEGESKSVIRSGTAFLNLVRKQVAVLACWGWTVELVNQQGILIGLTLDRLFSFNGPPRDSLGVFQLSGSPSPPTKHTDLHILSRHYN